MYVCVLVCQTIIFLPVGAFYTVQMNGLCICMCTACVRTYVCPSEHTNSDYVYFCAYIQTDSKNGTAFSVLSNLCCNAVFFAYVDYAVPICAQILTRKKRLSNCVAINKLRRRFHINLSNQLKKIIMQKADLSLSLPSEKEPKPPRPLDIKIPREIKLPEQIYIAKQ